MATNYIPGMLGSWTHMEEQIMKIFRELENLIAEANRLQNEIIKNNRFKNYKYDLEEEILNSRKSQLKLEGSKKAVNLALDKLSKNKKYYTSSSEIDEINNELKNKKDEILEVIDPAYEILKELNEVYGDLVFLTGTYDVTKLPTILK
jgi:thiamine biosynthesis lipoprotein ApbE